MNSPALSSIERWKSHVAESTWVRCYKQHWDAFLTLTGATAEELVKLTPREASDWAIAYYNKMKARGFSSKYCSAGYCAIRSFFAYNGVRLEKMSKQFTGKTQYKTYQQITPKQVFQMVEAVKNWRDKAAVGVVFQGGQRDGAVASLKLKHIITPNWEGAGAVVFDVPEFLPDVNGRNVNKREVHYRFGVLNDVVRYLKFHLDERREKGESITGESWLFKTNAAQRRVNYEKNKVFPICGAYINNVVVRAAEVIGIQSYMQTRIGKKRAQVTGQSGRTYFKTQTRLAGVDPDLREFMIGHTLPYAGAYDRFGVSEVTAALEQARSRLALTPEPADELEKKKQTFLDAARLLKSMMPQEEFERFTVELKRATTSIEVDCVVDRLKLREVKV
jgi:integrase